MILNFIKKYKIEIIFFILSFFILSFLLFQKGVWSYIDLNYDLKNFNDNSLNVDSFGLLKDSNSSYFGYDSFFVVITREVIGIFEGFLRLVFGFNIGTFLFYFIYLFLLFISTRKILHYFSSNKYLEIIPFIVVFNPINLYFLNESGWIYIGLSINFIIIGFYNFFKNKNIINLFYLLLFILGVFLLFSWPRVTMIFIIILFFIFIYFIKEIKEIFLKQTKKFLIMFFLTCIMLSSFLLFLFFQIKESSYSSGLMEFQKYSIRSNGESSYIYNKNKNIIESFYIKEIYNNFSSKYNNNIVFKIFSISYFFYIIFSSLFLLTNKQEIKIKIFIFSYLGIFLSFLMNNLGKFVDKDLFLNITFKYAPFLANDTSWVSIIFFISIIPLIYLITLNSSSKIKKIFLLISVFYLSLSIIPIIDLNNNKIKKVDFSKIPQEYQEEFFNKKDIQIEPSKFYPGQELYFDWSPYPISISTNNKYQNILTNNTRIVKEKQLNLDRVLQILLVSKKYCLNVCDSICNKSFVYNYRQKSFLKNSFLNSEYFYFSKLINISNSKILNLKNLIVFKDIKNYTKSDFDNFGFDFDYISKSKNYYSVFLSSKDLYKKEDNNYFSIFKLKGYEDYDFSIYSPNKIEYINSIYDFFDGSIDIFKKPIVIDRDSYNLKNIDDYKNLNISNNVNIEIKEGFNSKTKYYLKISNIEKNKPFIIQMNKTYSPFWKIKEITQKQYENIICENDYKEYSITQNRICNYKNKYLKNINFVKNDYIKSNHFEGNFIGNTWLIDSFSENDINKKDLYIVIFFEKEIYFQVYKYLVVSILLVVLFLGSFQYLKKMIKSKL